MKNFIKHQIGFLISGFVFWLPIAVIILIIVFLFNNLEDFGRNLLLLYVPERFIFPGFGIVLGVLFIYFTGMILKLGKVTRFFPEFLFWACLNATKPANTRAKPLPVETPAMKLIKEPHKMANVVSSNIAMMTCITPPRITSIEPIEIRFRRLLFIISPYILNAWRLP